MKYSVVLALAAVFLLSCVGVCSGQVFGHYTPARVVGDDDQSAGVYFTVQDDIIGLLGQFRYGASDMLDFGFHLGIQSVDDRIGNAGLYRMEGDTHLLISGDAKYMLRRADEEIPIDLSLDFGVGLINMEDASNVLFTFGGQGGWRGGEPQSRGLEPYLGLVLVVERKTWQLTDGENTEIDSELEVRAGTAYRVARAASIVAEIQAGRETAFGIGLNFNF
jgi:hypothetical protein